MKPLVFLAIEVQSQKLGFLEFHFRNQNNKLIAKFITLVKFSKKIFSLSSVTTSTFKTKFFFWVPASAYTMYNRNTRDNNIP
jgi:hypothetical protein